LEVLSYDEVAKPRFVGLLEGFGIPFSPYEPIEFIVFSPYIQVQVPRQIQLGIRDENRNANSIN
jgi:hypothetical protein